MKGVPKVLEELDDILSRKVIVQLGKDSLQEKMQVQKFRK